MAWRSKKVLLYVDFVKQKSCNEWSYCMILSSVSPCGQFSGKGANKELFDEYWLPPLLMNGALSLPVLYRGDRVLS